jgi:hypothetical protein
MSSTYRHYKAKCFCFHVSFGSQTRQREHETTGMHDSAPNIVSAQTSSSLEYSFSRPLFGFNGGSELGTSRPEGQKES